MTGKQIVKELLQIALYKVDNDECSEDDLKSIAKLLMKELHVTASVDTIAKIYGQSPNNVSNVISRNILPKGARKNVVLYDFNWFQRIIPSRWRK